MNKSKSKKPNALAQKIIGLLSYLHSHVTALNNSKLFAGLMIIVLNIASRFVTIKLSKSMESYLKYTFSRQILIFAIAWMGTRDIYIASVISIVFVLCMDYLFNENSKFCILPSHFMDYHIQLWEKESTSPNSTTISSPPSNGPPVASSGKPTKEPVSKEDLLNAFSVLERAKEQFGNMMDKQ